jgi:hypothetical protein
MVLAEECAKVEYGREVQQVVPGELGSPSTCSSACATSSGPNLQERPTASYSSSDVIHKLRAHPDNGFHADRQPGRGFLSG